MKKELSLIEAIEQLGKKGLSAAKRYGSIPQEYVETREYKEEIEIPSFAQPPAKEDIYAPRNLDEYIGQDKAKDICKIVVDAANIETRPIPNMLVFGPWGLGKTTLARLIMERHGKPYRFMDATLAAKLGYFKDYLIIDEIHNLPPETCDQLNTIMDQNLVHLVGCTTNPGSLPAPFRSRLRTITLENYEVEHIRVIIENAIRRKGLREVEEEAVQEISKRSRFNPRTALQILAFSLETLTVSGNKRLTLETTRLSMEKLGIDERGLTYVDRKYLEALSPTRPTGMSQLRAVLGTDIQTIETEIEPFLLRMKLVERTPRGRMLPEESLETLLKRSIEIKNNIIEGL